MEKKEYIVLNPDTQPIYGVEINVPYTIIGETECCYLIKNDSGEVAEINRKKCVYLKTLTPRCVEKRIDTTIIKRKNPKRFG